MRTVNIQDAKTHFSQLLALLEKGETITIARDGKPVANSFRTCTPTSPSAD
jgi:antitoxin (DNA-binding transcriptional repressor) of toxin-antitoxin stability system